MRALLLAAVVVLLGGADSWVFGNAERPKGPPDIYLTCQRERKVWGDGTEHSNWMEDPFSLEIWTKEGVISWREDYNARAEISRTTIEFNYSKSAEMSGPCFHHEVHGRIDRLTGYYRFSGNLYPTTDPGEARNRPLQAGAAEVLTLVPLEHHTPPGEAWRGASNTASSRIDDA
jgi:hypothetical protein